MERECFLQPLLQTVHRGKIDQLQFFSYSIESSFGILVGHLIVGLLKFLAKCALLRFRQESHHVFAFMVLTPLNESLLSKFFFDSFGKPFGTISDEQNRMVTGEPPRFQLLKRGQACKFAKMSIFSNFNLFQFAKMSRKTRLYDPGTLYHVILRGNGGQLIFFDDSDSRRFYQSSIGNLQKSGKWQMLSIKMILLSVVECIS